MRALPLIARIQGHVPGKAALAVLALAAAALKLYLLFERSVYIDPDEGYYCLLARNLVAGNGYALNGLPNIVYPPFLPLLIAALFAVTGKLQLSLILITAASGVALGVVCYRLASRLFSAWFSLWCVALVLFVYPLNAFLPIPRPYTENLYRGSDILGCCLLLTAVYLINRLTETHRYLYAVAAGGVFGLCYLTRPEGFLLFAIVLAALACLRLFSWSNLPYSRLLVCFLGFVIIALPYVLYLHSTVGEWTLSGKTGGARQYHESMLEVIRNDDWSRFHQQHYSLDTEHWEMDDQFWGAWRVPDSGSGTPLGELHSRATASLELYGRVLRTLFPWYIWILALPGMIASAHRGIRHRSHVDILLLLFIPFSLTVALLSYPVPRHHLFLVPIACIWATRGAALACLAARRLGRLENAVPVALVVLMAIGAVHEYHRKEQLSFLNRPAFVRSQLLERDVAQYLRKRSAGVIMSKFPGVAVRALSDWQVQPHASFGVLLQLADRKNVDYITVLQQENRRSYVLVIDVKNSYVPSSAEEPLRPVFLESGERYRLVIVVKDE